MTYKGRLCISNKNCNEEFLKITRREKRLYQYRVDLFRFRKSVEVCSLSNMILRGLTFVSWDVQFRYILIKERHLRMTRSNVDDF